MVHLIFVLLQNTSIDTIYKMFSNMHTLTINNQSSFIIKIQLIKFVTITYKDHSFEDAK